MPDSAGNRESWQQYDLTVTRYGGSGGSGYSNSNDFEESPAADPIQAVYPFETVTLDIPETKNSQDLHSTGSDDATASADSSDFIEGSACWKTLVKNSPNGFLQFGLREDNQLSDAPGKEGTSNAIGTLMFWFKNTMHTSSMTPGDINDDHLVSFEIRAKNFAQIDITNYWRRDGGDLSPYPANQSSLVEFDGDSHASYPLKDKWYHYAFWRNGVTGARKISIYDPIAEAILGTDKEFTAATDTLPYPDFVFNAWGLELYHWSLADMDYQPSEDAADLWTDEYVVAKTWLSDADVLKIRQGGYPS